MKTPSLLLLAASYVVHSGLISACDTSDTSGALSSNDKSCKPHSGLVRGYYPSYHFNDGGQTLGQINYGLYTDLIFFVVIPNANNTFSFDPVLAPGEGEKLARQFVAECKKNNVRPIVSIGGWTGSRLGIGCNSHNASDTVNFGFLAQDIRFLWPEVSLTAAISITGLIGSNGAAATPEETSVLVKNLDYINLMAYDAFGPWVAVTGPIAPLSGKCAPPGNDQSVETGYQAVISQGFRPDQILLGIPGYAKRSELISSKFKPTVVDGITSYIYQNHTITTPEGGKFDDKPGVDVCGAPTTWGGSFLTVELISNGWLSDDERKGRNGYKRYFDECSSTPFLTNGKYFISYDDTQSTVLKAKFAKEKKLAGVYFFDTQGPTDATVKAARHIIRNR